MGMVSTASPPASSPAASPLLRLPAELQVAIASELDYFDLRHLEMVCKRFQTLMKEPELESKLFRRGPTNRLPEGQEIDIHPMLRRRDCTGRLPFGKGQEELAGEGSEPDTEQSRRDAFAYAAVDDFATNPACESISIEIPNVAMAPVRCATGVTVRMLFEQVGKGIAETFCPLDLAHLPDASRPGVFYHVDTSLRFAPCCWMFRPLAIVGSRSTKISAATVSLI
ncbi:hypothetical protein JCM8202_001768 [Rhodotorula sphaerocarpa]